MNPTRITTVLAAALAAIALTGAGAAGAGAGALSPPAPGRPDPQIADGTLQRRLDTAGTRWKAAHLRSYRYEIQVSCFCAPRNAHVVYVVRNGVPRVPAKGEKSVATVPRLFRTIQAAIDDGVANLDATYGPRGVPKSIYIDSSAQIADEEVGYTIVHFTRLQ